MVEHVGPTGLDERNFVTNVARIRDELGWTQTELARKMVESGFETYNQMTVSRTEKGDRPLRLSEARALCSIFGRSLEDMIKPSDESALADALQDALTKIGGHNLAIADSTIGMLVEMDKLKKTLERIKSAGWLDESRKETKPLETKWGVFTVHVIKGLELIAKDAEKALESDPESAVAFGREQYEKMHSPEAEGAIEAAGDQYIATQADINRGR